MSENEQGPPALSGEVWRGQGAFSALVVVLDTGDVQRWNGRAWIREHPTRTGSALRGAFLAERARAEKAESAAASLRTALDAERLSVGSMALALIEAHGKVRAAEDRAERAEKIAAAERALRVAVDEWALNMTRAKRHACRDAEAVLLALGVDP